MIQGRRFAIIVAGGKGLRMGGDIPKQFALIEDKPVLLHTLTCFAPLCDELILVLPSEHIPYWQALVKSYSDVPPHQVVTGGATRFHSVQQGLQHIASRGINDSDLVAIHDGVRPFVARSVITACFEQAKLHGAALPYRPVVDSLRRYSPNTEESYAVIRHEYIAVQTPQTFMLMPLYQAYQSDYIEHFTDDASVWEYAGFACPRLVLGNEENIKLTNPIDMQLAKAIISQGIGQ